jgi:uncharacterized protein YkwD
MSVNPRFSLPFIFLALLVCGLIVNGQEPAKNSGGPAFLSSMEAEVIKEINQARANPQKYAAYLEESKKYYKGNIYSPPSAQIPLRKVDGVAGVDEAIRFLKASSPLGPLQPSHGLSLGAKDHVLDLTSRGTSGHRGSDGSLPHERISRYGTWTDTVGEAILFQVTTAREMVLDLIVDDGVPDRGHRKNVFEPGFQVAGVAISPQTGLEGFCVIDYAGGFADRDGLRTARTAERLREVMIKMPAATKPSNAKSNKQR